MPDRFVHMLCLILAGEAIFSLPFHIARFFRKPVLDVFGFSNADLGDVFAVYGVTAMIAYFPGGVVADRFSARKLITVSLVATALGGFYLATIPGFTGMCVLFAYWGVTSILLLWAALIRATRDWGGNTSQGRAFGVLDGGRGLLAAGLASVAVVIFARLYDEAGAATDAAQRTTALVAVIYFYTAVTLAAGIAAWLFIPETGARPPTSAAVSRRNVGDVLREPVVWAQAAIVVCAYCGYKGLDNYALYAVDVLGMGEAQGAGFAAANAYLRPVAAVAAGFLADRASAARVVLALFAILAAGYGWLGVAAPTAATVFVTLNIAVTFAGVYALRGVYFALLEECRVPLHQTGTAVGVISLVGFTPDIFFAAIGGRLIDASPGITGHQHYFAFLAAIMLAGAVVALLIAVLRGRAAPAAVTPPRGG